MRRRLGIAPEKLLHAVLPQVSYSVRAERQLMEQNQHSQLFCWFAGLAIDERSDSTL